MVDCALWSIRTGALIVVLLFAFLILSLREIDDRNMDSYDRFYGISGDGRTRGVLGTIYDSKGQVDAWATFTDHNPYWN